MPGRLRCVLDPEPLSGGGNVGLGCAGCRVLFRDCVTYPERGSRTRT
jgi:hypothetical protein